MDTALETGKPTYVISSFPFRPSGHASDASPASSSSSTSQSPSEATTRVCRPALRGIGRTEAAWHWGGGDPDADYADGDADGEWW